MIRAFIPMILSCLMALALGTARSAGAQPAPCPSAPLLPAYAHNDYLNDRPLTDALALGYRGVEVDLYLHRGRLVLSHDGRHVAGAPGFEETYLVPLDGMVRRCGTILANHEPFLLTIELKQASRAAFDSLVSVLGRHRTLLEDEPGVPAPLQVVLVGWHPPGSALPAGIGSQSRVTRLGEVPPCDPAQAVTLVSLDYSQSIRWTDGVAPSTLPEWLRTLAAARAACPGSRSRVHAAPVNRDMFAALLGGGVDLIGVRDLAAGRAALLDTSRE